VNPFNEKKKKMFGFKIVRIKNTADIADKFSEKFYKEKI
jgi:hypothetical protein